MDDRNENIGKCEDNKSATDKTSKLKRLMQAVLDSGAYFFKDFGTDEGYCAPYCNGLTVFMIHSKECKKWIRQVARNNELSVINHTTMDTILSELDSYAEFGTTQYKPFTVPLAVRAQISGDTVYYDLGSKIVRITSEGWEIDHRPGIIFKRFNINEKQIVPLSNDGIDSINQFLDLWDMDETTKLVLKVYIISCFIPDFPHPILVALGPQGSGKSVFVRLLKKLIDPAKIRFSTPPQRYDDFIIHCQHNYVVAIDNLSHISPWMSDLFCRLCTGEGFTKRRLFTDDDEIFYSLQRILILNGIAPNLDYPDLCDRSLVINLERIERGKRLTEEEIEITFNRLRPKMLGSIFNVISKSLSEYPNIELNSLSRMAGFEKWGCAIAEALGSDKAGFQDAYYNLMNRQEQELVESHPLGKTVLLLMENEPYKSGTPTDLYNELKDIASDKDINIKAREWPKGPNWLWRKLQTIRNTLESSGITITRSEGKERTIEIIKKKNAVDAVNAEETVAEQGQLPIS